MIELETILTMRFSYVAPSGARILTAWIQGFRTTLRCVLHPWLPYVAAFAAGCAELNMTTAICGASSLQQSNSVPISQGVSPLATICRRGAAWIGMVNDPGVSHYASLRASPLATLCCRIRGWVDARLAVIN